MPAAGPSHPELSSSVETFWEGEVVDGTNHGFFSTRWGADRATDLRHWCKFAPFTPLKDAVAADGAAAVDLGRYSHVFMRWKEMHFINVRRPAAPPPRERRMGAAVIAAGVPRLTRTAVSRFRGSTTSASRARMVRPPPSLALAPSLLESI